MKTTTTFEKLYNKNNYPTFSWFFTLMAEVKLLEENNPEIDIRNDFLNDIVKTQLKNLKLGYSILNNLYKKFTDVINGKEYNEIFLDDFKNLVIIHSKGSLFIKKETYEKFKNLDKYFEPYIEENKKDLKIKNISLTEMIPEKELDNILQKLEKYKFIIKNTENKYIWKGSPLYTKRNEKSQLVALSLKLKNKFNKKYLDKDIWKGFTSFFNIEMSETPFKSSETDKVSDDLIKLFYFI